MADKHARGNIYQSAGIAGMLVAASDTVLILSEKDLDLFEDGKLKYLMTLLDDASDIINEHLTEKAKKLKRLN